MGSRPGCVSKALQVILMQSQEPLVDCVGLCEISSHSAAFPSGFSQNALHWGGGSMEQKANGRDVWDVQELLQFSGLALQRSHSLGHLEMMLAVSLQKNPEPFQSLP